jgi:ketosteroid isomerase-like protein
MRKEVRAWFGTWSDYRQEVEQMLDAGEDVVVVLRESGTGKGNGAPMDQRIGVVFTVRDELTIRQTLHREPEDALRPAGVTE